MFFHLGPASPPQPRDFQKIPAQVGSKNVYKHKFKNCIDPKCTCSSGNESTSQFFLHCHFYIPIRNSLFETLKETIKNLQKLCD